MDEIHDKIVRPGVKMSYRGITVQCNHMRTKVQNMRVCWKMLRDGCKEAGVKEPTEKDKINDTLVIEYYREY